MPAATSSWSDLREAVEHIDRGPHLLDPVVHHAALAEDGRYRDDGRDGERRKADHAGELGADLQMAQQLHHSLYEMVVIAHIGSMKFLPIMKTGVRRPAARATVRSLMRNRAGKAPCVGARRVFCGRKTIVRTLVVIEPGWERAMNRFVHRLIMSVLLVAALVLDLERAGLALRSAPANRRCHP